jgi:E3 ubiquitin-protein ligase synoviolin
MWFFVTESLLAFTIFRDEFDIPFGVMFLFLLFVKSFHWLMADRVEWVRFLDHLMLTHVLSLSQMNQMPYPGPSSLFHFRIQALFIVLYLTDVAMILLAINNVATNGVGAIVLFASEVRARPLTIFGQPI